MKKVSLTLAVSLFVTVFSSINYAQYYYNKAGSFNGTNSHLAVANDGEVNPTTGTTMEAWIYPKIGQCATIIGKNYTTNYWFGLCNTLRFYAKGSGSSVTSPTVIPTNKWTHVAVTYDGSVTKMYINGLLDYTATPSSIGPMVPNADSLYLGGDVMGFFFNGYIDNARIWNVVRTASQIQNNMYIPLQMKKPTGNFIGLNATYLFDWDETEWSGTAFNRGYLRNLPLLDLNGKPVNYIDYNNSLVLDGNSYCAIENYADFNPTTAVTLEAWIKRDLSVPSTTAQIIIAKGSLTRDDYLMFLNPSGQLYFEINNSAIGGTIYGNTVATIADAAWHHVATSYNSADGKIILFIDGTQSYQVIIPSKPAIPNDPDSLFIGWASEMGPNNKFRGQIDEVRIWKDVVRTEAQIKADLFSTRSYLSGGTPNCSIITFREYTNYVTVSNGAMFSPINFRGNASLSSSHLQNDYTAPLLFNFETAFRQSDFTMSPNRTIIPAGGTVYDSLTITGAGTVNNVQLFVALNHGAVGKLSMSLISPTGISVNLLPAQNAALTDHDIITVFDPAADSTINFTTGLKAPFSPRVKPFGNFSSFNGSLAAGKWKLKVTDATTGTMLRVLNAWGMKLGVTVGINDKVLPDKFELIQNYPNPFNPVTTISYSIPRTSFVKLMVFDELGREVSMLVSENKLPGKYEVKFDASNLSSGVYFYQLNAGDFRQTKKIVLMK